MRSGTDRRRGVGAGIVVGLGMTGLAALGAASCVETSSERGGDPSLPGSAGPPPTREARAIAAALRREHPTLFASEARQPQQDSVGTRIRAVDGGFEPVCAGACPAHVRVPGRASEPTTVLEARSGVGARFALAHAAAVPATVDGDLVVYPGALVPAGSLHDGARPGGDLIHRVGSHGTEDFARFEAPPPGEELRYTVWPVGARALRQVEGVLEVLDAGGVPRVRVAPPWLIDATGRRLPAVLEVDGCALDVDPRAPWSRPLVELDEASCTVVVRWDEAGAVYPILVDPSWSEAGNMVEPRTHHSATLLPGVGVLLAGGFDVDGVALPSAEIGCPAEICGFPIYAATGSMAEARGAHGDAPLDGERVVVTGGRNARAGAALASAEVYDTASGTFEAIGPMARARDGHTTTRVGSSGDVLIAGGDGVSPSTAEVLDGDQLTFGAPVAMTARRSFHAAEALERDGMVLLVGGLGAGGFPLQTAEIFDRATGAFTLVDDEMTAPRAFATATLLDDGSVLVTGGTNGAGVFYSTADIFEPDGAGGGSFQQQPVVMERPRAFHRATKLLGTPGVPGLVLLTGGFDGEAILRASEVFDADSVAFQLASTMIRARAFHTATRLESGQVLVTGGGFDTTTTDVDAARSTELLLRDDGEPCAAAAECESGFCPGAPSGVCCDQACEETCETCITGSCLVVPDDSTVKPICSDAVEILLVCVEGEVDAGAIEPCGAFACDGDQCGDSCETDAECSATGWCDGALCQPEVVVGGDCTEDRECELGFCADGVCCNARCDGQCEACDLTGSVGVCRQNQGAPRPGRPVCEGAGGPCEGTCGSEPDACDYEPVVCSAGVCADGQLTVGRCHIEERGACAETTEACGAYACASSGDACVEDCSTVDDCAAGHACRPDGQCVLVEQAECDGDTVVSPDGTSRDCAPFACRDGACVERCTSVDDCTAPSVCDEAGACVDPPADPPPPEGCSITAPLPARGAGWALVVAGVAVVAASRRRRTEVAS